MKKILFASDLDNTLLYSYKHKKIDDICVEINKGKEQGFMTKETICLLRKVKQCLCFVPVTTRSIEQYRRIQWPEGCEPEYAVTTNGAVLLHQGEIDRCWQKARQQELQGWQGELRRQYTLQSRDTRFIRCRLVDDAYLFTYCEPGVSLEDCLPSCRENTSLQVQGSGKKIYFFPPGLNKGMALQKLQERFTIGKTYAAGDSSIDLSMLLRADEAFLPEKLPLPLAVGSCGWKFHRYEGKDSFAEWLLQEILFFREEGTVLVY